MNAGVSLAARGRNFTRSVLLRAGGCGLDVDSIRQTALTRWGPVGAEDIAKAAVSALGTSDTGNQSPAAVEFFDLVRAQSIYGRLTGLRKIPFRVRMIRMTGGSRGYWVGQAKPIPVSKAALLNTAGIEPAQVAAITVVTDEAVRFGGVAESTFEADLRRAVAASWDEAFLDRTNAGEATSIEVIRPAAVTYGAPSVAGSGDPVADIAALVEGFAGDLGAAIFVTDPKTAAQLGLYRNGSGLVFPDVGPRGGTIVGIQVLTSSSSPRDSDGGQIALIDPTGIAGGDGGIEVDRSDVAAIQMSDTPEEGPTELVSLFQCNLVALKSVVFVNWRVERPGSVSVLTNADYPPAS